MAKRALPLLYEEVEALPLERLKEIPIIEGVEGCIAEVEIVRDWGDAQNIVRILEKKFPELLDVAASGEAVAARYRKIWARAAFMAFALATQAQLEQLYRNHILTVFSHHEDPRVVFDEQLYSLGYHASLVPRLEAVGMALQENTEVIGAQPLVRSNRETVPPQVRWWLAEYRGSFGSSVRRGALEQSKFLAQNPNVKMLTQEEKAMFTKTIQFLDFIFFPTFQMNRRTGLLINLEERIRADAAAKGKTDAIGYIQSEFAATPPAALSLPKPQGPVPREAAPSVTPSLPRPPAPVQLAAQSPRKAPPVLKSPGEDVVGMIRRMVEQGQTHNIVEGAISLTPQTLAKSLRNAYMRRAGMSESDAAREAVHIANMLKKQGKPEFMEMAYFDIKENLFKWK